MAINMPYSISLSGKTVDASSPIVVSWQISGSVSTGFTINIYNNATGLSVWSTTQTSYALQYTIPSGALSNGITYKLTITATGQDGSTATSLPVTFQASSTPTVTIPTIGTVGNQNISLTATYQQKENVSLSNWIAILYDNNYNILQQSSLQTTTTQPTTQTSPLSYYLTYQFTGLNTNNTYYVEFQATSNLNLTGTTGKVKFTTSFSQPTLYSNIQATNTPDCGINLQWYVNQIIGQSTTTLVYPNNNSVDLTTGNSVWFNQGFNINNNFTLKIWLSSVTNYQFTITPVIIASATTPTNINALWVYDPARTTPVTLGIETFASTPTNTNNLWIKDSTFTTETMYSGVVIDTTQPTTNVVWVDTTNPKNGLALVTMQGSNGQITLEYTNGAFNLYTVDSNNNKTLQSTYTVSGNSYYVYIQQIGNSYNLSAQKLS